MAKIAHFFPLRTPQIRLLRLNPQLHSYEPGCLEVVDIEEAPPYYALSHSWTDQSSHHTAHIKNQPFTIDSELLCCIQRLAGSTDTKSSSGVPVEHVWIDTICIDQRNARELSSQVAMMGEIYHHAVRTVVWLGFEGATTCSAWELLDDIYSVFRKESPNANLPSDIPLCVYSNTQHTSYGLPSWDHEVWSSLRHLLSLRWFSRIWVVQEVALSRGDPLLLHNNHCYSWSRLGWVAAWLRRKGYLRLPQMPENLSNVDTMTDLRRSRGHWPLDALMSITQVKFHASDQRDKVYALLGLASEYRDLSSRPQELIPDYTINVSDLYVKIACFFMQRNQSLAFLSRARGLSGSATQQQRCYDLGLPTWSPDWSDFKGSNRAISTSLSWIDYSDTSRPVRFGFPKHYRAFVEVPLDMALVDNGAVLRLRGVICDQISQVVASSIMRFADDRLGDSLASRTIQIFTESAAMLTEENLLQWMESLIRATTVQQHYLIGRDDRQSIMDGLSYFRDLLTEHPSLLALCEHQSGNTGLLGLLDDLSIEGVPQNYETLARNYGFDRAFVVTTGGRLGLGPSNIRKGDSIALLASSGVPYCMREGVDSWQLIGESYIEGLMGGEITHIRQQQAMREEYLHLK